jgi:regulator of replication initiation timing
MNVNTLDNAGLDVMDLEGALVDARSDAIAYREMALAGLDQLSEMTTRVKRLVAANIRLHDEYRSLRERCARESLLMIVKPDTPNDRSAT